MNTRIAHVVVALSTLTLSLLAACETDGGGGGTTKLDECRRLAAAYCDRAVAVACPDASSCLSAQQTACGQAFDGTCGASAEDREQVDHDIANIINPKETCDALHSVDSYLMGTVQAIAARPCEGTGSSGDGNGVPLDVLCEEGASAVCLKVIDLGCASMNLTECTQALFASGAIVLVDYTCTGSDPSTPATEAQQAEYDTAMATLNTVTDCSQLY